MRSGEGMGEDGLNAGGNGACATEERVIDGLILLGLCAKCFRMG